MFESKSVKEIEETICINIEKSRVPLEGSILSTSPSSHPSLSLTEYWALSRRGEVKMVRCEHSLIVYCLPLCLVCLASSHQFPHLRGSVVALISTHKLGVGVEIRNILITLLDIWLKTSPLQGSLSPPVHGNNAQVSLNLTLKGW